MIEEIYHFTSKKNYLDIKKSGTILPKTRIEWIYSPNEFSIKTTSICSYKFYTVGLPSLFHEGWMRNSLWYELFRLITCDILLKIRIPEHSKGFVREHLFCTPKYMKEKYNKNLYVMAYNGQISPKDPRIRQCLRMYWNSSIPLSKYKKDYEVPEVWIPERISFNDVSVIKMGEREKKGYCQIAKSKLETRKLYNTEKNNKHYLDSSGRVLSHASSR